MVKLIFLKVTLKDSCNIYCIESIQNKIKVEIYVLNCIENVRLIKMINK